MAKKNFTSTTVATAPSPATTGTSLVVATGKGSLFAINEPAIIFPANDQPLTSNAEIVKVSNVVGDTLTIVRGQESTTARSIVAGDIIIQGITAKDWNDLVASKFTWKGAWATSTVYAVNDTVQQGGSGYVCVSAHTSGTFATDLSAGKWNLLVEGLPTPNLTTSTTTNLTGVITGNGSVIGSKANPSGAFVGTTDTQTLTNKTINVSNNTLSGMLDWFYPIGTIYETTSTDLDTTTKMGNHFGGTWESYGDGRVLVAKSSDTEFDTIGETGGAKTVTLTAAQSGVPAHNHTQNAHYHDAIHYVDTGRPIRLNSSPAGTNSYYLGSWNTGNSTSPELRTSNATPTNNNNTAASASEAHTNLQPYIVVYRYRRVS